MRSATLTFALLLYVLPGIASGETQPQATEATIRALFQEGTAAWNRGDLEAYLAGYWDSEKTRFTSGSRVLRGKKAIAAMFRSRFPSREQMGTFNVTNLEIQLLGDEDALVFGEWVHTVAGKDRRGAFTVHLARLDGAWVVVSDHTSSETIP